MTVEDYFHAAALRRWVAADTWYRFDSRLPASIRHTLDILESCGAKATFFVGSEVVESSPDLVRGIAGHGHEVAVRGELCSRPTELGRAELREELRRLREDLEQVAGCRVYGYRAAAWLSGTDLSLLEALADTGFAYDSSVCPPLLPDPFPSRPSEEQPSAVPAGFHEIPLSSVALCGLNFPIGGGTALRVLPPTWLRRAVPRLVHHRGGPYVLNVRPWELDAEQPRIDGASATARLRQYWNLEGMPERLEDLLTAYRFTSVATHMGLRAASIPAKSARVRPADPEQRRRGIAPSGRPLPRPTHEPLPVTVVVPCYNESQSLRYLANTLASLRAEFEDRYAFAFLFVDDRSSDNTWCLLEELFGGRADCRLLRHERNQGIAAAIETGLRHAQTAVVCSMDCDCTYDPHELGHMIPLLTDGVDLVVASPYHPAGGVRNVPVWRVALSQSLSRLYRLVLRQKLFTYTSCFRVYRRGAVVGMAVRRPGFLGIAELITLLDLAGHRIVEYPTVLEVRVLGRSKMRLLRTVYGHLGLLLDVGLARVAGNRGPQTLLRP
ncbi:MAG: glycosyltransferase [Gemmatimonadales bacterium]